jgi:hypothetical protein
MPRGVAAVEEDDPAAFLNLVRAAAGRTAGAQNFLDLVSNTNYGASSAFMILVVADGRSVTARAPSSCAPP